jgi:hypothetical protein
LAPPVIACAGVLISLSACAPSRKPEPAESRDVAVESRPNRVIYPFSLVPGGVLDGAEVAAIRVADAAVRNHYSDVGSRLTRETMPRDEWLYTSYRVGASVYWTKHTVRVRAGEAVLSDGVHMIRARCGNRLSAVPNKPTRLIDPPSIFQDTPTIDTPTGVPDGNPPEVTFANPGGDPLDIPVDLPGRPATPVSHPIPTSVTPTQPAVTTTRVIVTGPAAALLPPRTNVAVITAPEPGTWAMMLGGLGIIGFTARRIRKAPHS